jgi:multisubunit Na+/H+ antiporter MnhE subunit
MFTRAVCWLAEFAVLFCVWLLFVDRLAWSETLVGIGAAALAATGAEVVRGQEHPRFLPRAAWIVEFWRLPGQILRDCAHLLLNLLHRRTGRFLTVAFRAGGADAHSVARRALAIMYTTLPPNTIVIGIDRKRHVMLLHMLEPGTPLVLGGTR